MASDKFIFLTEEKLDTHKVHIENLYAKETYVGSLPIKKEKENVTLDDFITYLQKLWDSQCAGVKNPVYGLFKPQFMENAIGILDGEQSIYFPIVEINGDKTFNLSNALMVSWYNTENPVSVCQIEVDKNNQVIRNLIGADPLKSVGLDYYYNFPDSVDKSLYSSESYIKGSPTLKLKM